RRVHLPLLPLVVPADEVDLPGERVEPGPLAQVQEGGQLGGGDLVVDAGLLEDGGLVGGPCGLVGADGEGATRLCKFGAHGRTSFLVVVWVVGVRPTWAEAPARAVVSIRRHRPAGCRCGAGPGRSPQRRPAVRRPRRAPGRGCGGGP